MSEKHMTLRIWTAFVVANVVAIASSRAELPLGIAAEPPTDGPVIEVEGGYMVPYTATIPGTDVTFEMVPIPGGKFTIGSPDDEADRRDDEGPQVEITVAPFWMGKHEVTLAEYKQYMDLIGPFARFKDGGIRKVTEENRVDAVTAPSRPYDASFYFPNGEDDDLPTSGVSQYAAKQYTKWLSLLSDASYRLPTEAEWEYACRAGTSTAFYFGDDPKMLSEYGWSYENSEELTQPVGQKKPNAWGLYDMHGNVAEWTLDAYTKHGYADWTGKDLASELAVHWPDSAYPCVVRGGSSYLDAVDCRSAARIGSNKDEWQTYDPELPASPWWLASDEGAFVGMRIVRVPGKFDPDMQTKVWQVNDEKFEQQVATRIDRDGRSHRGIVDKNLPAAIKNLPSRER
jgi:formylglycine-generating enzyme required for sulfatase activity